MRPFVLWLQFILLLCAFPIAVNSKSRRRRKSCKQKATSASSITMAGSVKSAIVVKMEELSLDDNEQCRKSELIRTLRETLRKHDGPSSACRAVANNILPKILDFLKQVLPNYKEPLYVGSAYEGWSVSSRDSNTNCPEYDVVLVCSGDDLKAKKLDSGYWTLHQDSDEAQQLSSERKVQDLIGLLGKGSNALQVNEEGLNFRIKQRLGSAVSQVTQDGVSVIFAFIPCYRLNSSDLYLPSFTQKDQGNGKWIRAFPGKEKETLKKEGCVKDLLRLLKILRNQESSLKKLTSYQFKTVVLHELSKKSLSWEHHDLGARWLGALRGLIQFLERKHIPYFHDSSMNMFPVVGNSIAVDNMIQRLKVIERKDREANSNCGASPKGVSDVVDGQENKELLGLLRSYFAAKVPASQGFAEGQKQLMQDVVPLIKDQLRQETLVSDIRYTGSAYEGVNLKSTSDYDLMVVLDGRKKVKIHHEVPSFAILITDDLFMRENFCNADSLIKPAKVISYFMGLVTKILNRVKKNPNFDARLQLIPREHGPAIEIELRRGDDQVFMDITPAFMLSDTIRYIAKTLKPKQMATNLLRGFDPKMFWRQSFSFEEVALLRSADQDGGCRKMVLRITKALRKDVGALAKLSSYHMKTLMMHAMKKSELDWSQQNLVARFLDFLRMLAESLDRKFIEHYFVSGFNLYQGIGDDTFVNMRNKVLRILNNPNEQRKVFDV